MDGLVRRLAVEGEIPRAAEENGRLGDEGGVHRHPWIEMTDEVGVRHVVGPGDLERLRRAVEASDGATVGLRQRAEHADSGVQHELGRAHPGHQRDLGIPAFDRKRRSKAERVAVRVLDHLLLGDRQGDAATAGFALLAQRPDLAQELQRLLRRAVVERALDARVVELLAAAHEGAAARRPRCLRRSRRPPCPRRARVESRPGAGCPRPRRSAVDRGGPCRRARTGSDPVRAPPCPSARRG